jgi:dolichol-phosphate mannosyltransferase
MYEGFGETWREWGRSLDLKDASARGQVWGDLGFLILVQGLPLLLLLVFGALLWGGYDFLTLRVALGLNLVLVLIRFALLGAIVPSYCWDRRELGSSWLFWLSPCADPLAVLRIFLSTVQKPKFWRGRIYSTENK